MCLDILYIQTLYNMSIQIKITNMNTSIYGHLPNVDIPLI